MKFTDCLDLSTLERVCGCGRRFMHNREICFRCRNILTQHRERDLFEKAEKIPWRVYSGPVHWESDGYVLCKYANVIDFVNAVLGEYPPDCCPGYVWWCDVTNIELDAFSVIYEELTCQGFVNFSKSDLVELDKLQLALDDWAWKQELKHWDANFNKAVILDGIVDHCTKLKLNGA